MARRPKAYRKPAAKRANIAAPRKRWNLPATQLDRLIAVMLVLLTAAVYVQTIGFEFTNFDDTAYVPDNSHVRGGFSLAGVGWAFTTFETANWYPLTWLSLMLDCHVFGPRPGVHHAVNAILHAANVLLLFVMLKRMTGRRWASAAVAALFAVHPLHVESVAWIAERKDVLSTLFFLFALLAYHRYAARPSFGRWFLVLLAMAVGLLAKPMLVTLPFVLLLLDWWPLGRLQGSFSKVGDVAILQAQSSDFRFGRNVGDLVESNATGATVRRPWYVLIAEKVPLLLLSVAAAWVTMIAQASQGATKMIGDKTALSLRLANAAIAYVKYLERTFWPVDLAAFYPYNFHPRPALVAASIVVLIVVTVVALWLVRRAPYLAVGWFWYLGTLVPTIGLVQVGAQALADRYMYIPSIGIFVAIVWAAMDCVRRPAAIAAGFATIIAAMSFAAYRQTSYWATSELLFRHALAVTGDNPISCESLGDTLLHHERFAEAEAQFRKTLALDPVNFRQVPGELAEALAGQGRIDEAIKLIHNSALDDLDRAKALDRVGMFLAMRYRFEGIPLLEEAMKLAPKQAAPCRDLAFIYATCPAKYKIRNGPKAVELGRRACELSHWSDVRCLVTLADAYHETGQREQEIEQLRAAAKLHPKDAAIAARLKKVLSQ